MVAERYIDLLKAELRELCKNGGILTPSVYDTAQVLRHTPPADTVALVQWLLRQQKADGGWGDAGGDNLPRHAPTLAALLALHERGNSEESQQAVQRGLGFIRDTANVWGGGGTLPGDIPVAAELVVPMLLDEAAKAGLQLPQEPFQALRALGTKRKQLIAKVNPPAGTAPVHTWEAWGTEPTDNVLDTSGGVGHSPAATAIWLRMRRTLSPTDRSEKVLGAERFMEQCAAATGVGIPGVVPTVWPIGRFEQSWALYALCVLNQHNHPALREVARPQFEDLKAAVKPIGIGMSDDFVPDGDLTTTTLALLSEAGLEVDARIMDRFMGDKHFITYDNELQVSLTTTAHGVLAFALVKRASSHLIRLMVEEQDGDGLWKRDKWHKSWLYTTSQVMIALARAGETQALGKAVQGLLAEQHADGGWGFAPAPSLAETAYAVHALFSLKGSVLFSADVQRALHRAARFMQSREQQVQNLTETYWIGKELFCPYRVDRAFVLTALLALASEQEALAAA